MIESAGRTYPVDVRWRPAAIAGKRRSPRIEQTVGDAVRTAVREETGDVLVFLPGIGEIRRTQIALEGSLPGDVDVVPLAGALSLAEQDAALAPSPPGRRRVVLATDIAETSLTVAGVRVVVDSGLARAPRFDTRTGMTRLTTITTSRASADQRAGRAGRLEPGVCYRLWSKVEHGTRQAHRQPEIDRGRPRRAGARARRVGHAGGRADVHDPAAARRRSAPAASCSPSSARSIPTVPSPPMVGGCWHCRSIPRLAAMLVAEPSALGCAIAALLDERDVLRGATDELPSDLAVRLRAIAGLRQPRTRRPARRRRVSATAPPISRAGSASPSTPRTIDADRAGAALLHAYPDRLAARRRPGQFQLRSGTGAWLAERDPLAHEDFVVAADLDGRRDRARIRLAAALDADEVARELAEQVTESVQARVGRRTATMSSSASSAGSERCDSASRCAPRRPAPKRHVRCSARVTATGLAVLGWNAASLALRQRVAFLHRTVGEPWPDWSAEALTRTVDDWLAPVPRRRRQPRRSWSASISSTVLRSQLPWPDGARLDELAPPALALATGRSVAIDYSGDEPVARVRVQDLFGTTRHPTAGGRPIVLHLLSPADRPIQITADLPGFWAGSWADVRKELAGRYPKHQWPIDPANAATEATERSLIQRLPLPHRGGGWFVIRLERASRSRSSDADA